MKEKKEVIHLEDGTTKNKTNKKVYAGRWFY